MTEATPKSKRRRWVIVMAVLGLVILVGLLAAGWYITSSHFNSWTRAKLVAQLEDMTGGRVEIGGLQWSLSKLEFDVRDITIHGNEGPDQVPYAHADRLVIRAKILSFMQREIALRSVEIDRPVIHIIVYPDGHTNQPTPKVVSRNSQAPVQQLFDVSINHAEIKNGEFIVNEHRLPLDLAINDLRATMDHVSSDDRYDGKLMLGAINAKYGKFLPADANAEVDYHLSRDQLELSSFHVTSGKLRVDGTGKLTNFLKPTVQVAYRATFNWQEIGRIIKAQELRSGVVDLQGIAQYNANEIHSSGKLVVRGLDYRSGNVRLPGMDAASDFAIDLNKLTLSHLVARVAGGIVKGDVTVANWTGGSQSPGKSVPPQSGVAHLRIDSLPIGRLADSFSTKKLDLGALRLVGDGKGTIEARWKGSLSRATADATLTVIPPAQPVEGELPVTADFKGSVDVARGELRLDPLNVMLPMLRLNATGAIGGNGQDLRVSASVTDLSRLQPMLALANQQNGTAAQLTGKLSFEGTVSGKLTPPSVQGHLAVSDFTFPVSAILKSDNVQPQPQRVHIDDASGDVTYTPQTLVVHNGVLRKAGTQLNVELVAGLVDGKVEDNSSIAADFVVRNASVSELQQIAGLTYPVSGTLNANLNIKGTKGNPQGGGHLQLTNGSVYGEPIKSAAADIRLLNRDASVQNLVVVHNGAQITGTGTYNLKTTAFQFHAVGSNFQLATLRRLNTARVNLAGLLNFNATGSGTLSMPIINGTARVQNFVLNGQRVGDATLTAITQGDTLKLAARSNFHNADLSADGSIKVHDPLLPANITVHFDNFNFMPFLQSAMPVKMTGSSYVGGNLTLQGPLKLPKDLTVLAVIPTLRAEMQGVQISNPEPIRISMANEVVRVDSFHLVGADTELTTRGTIDLNGNQRVRLRVNGRMNLKLAQSFNSDLYSGGLLDLNVSIGGVLTKPDLQGELKVTNGSVNLIDFPNGLSNINGTLVFTEDRVQVQSLKAHTGGGDIQIGGSVTYSPQLAFNLTADGQGIRLRYPQGVSSTANLALKLTGTLNNSNLSGDITITRFGLNRQFDLAMYVAKSNRPSEAPRASPLTNLHLNLHVVSTPELQVQSSLAKVAGNLDLHVRGSAVNPVVLGRVNLTEGELTFNGQKYRLQRGDVTLNNPTRTEPNIDAEVTARVRDYDITLGVHGPVTHLIPNYRSDPPLPEADIINLLAFGRTREEAEIAYSQTSNNYTNTVSSAVLGSAIDTAVSNRVQKLFGVSRIKISPELGSTTNNPTAQVTIEQQVSSKVTITYVTNLAQSSQQSIFVEYNINPNVSIVGGRDQYGVVSFDVRIRQRKR